MRIFFVCSIFILVQGCSVISREAGYPGGNVGYLADRHTLFARGQNQQVNRYFVTLSLLAPLIAETVQGSGEAKLSAERISDLYGDIERLEAAAKRCTIPNNLTKESKIQEVRLSEATCSNADAGNIDGSALSFESLSFEVNKSLSDALKQAFDNLDIRANAARIIVLEPTEILKTVLKSRHLVPVLLRYLSSYRDISIIFGLSIADSCNKTLDSYPADPIADECEQLAEKFGQLIDRTRESDSDIAGDERPIYHVFKAGEQALNGGLDWKISPKHRIALLHHVNRACNKLDALAKIDHKGFKGCTINLIGKVTPVGSNTDAQSAVNKLIEEVTQ